MLQRLYINNFRCLDNFELVLSDLPASLLIGKNGTGKSSVRKVLEILQNIGRGENRLRDLVKVKDFGHGKKHSPIRFDLEVLINDDRYRYIVAFELPEGSGELRILEEGLAVNGQVIYSREEAQVTLNSSWNSRFSVDWHLVALPVIQQPSDSDPLHIFRNWLTKMIILSPVPMLMEGTSSGKSLEPDVYGKNFGEWFSGLLAHYPAAYMTMSEYLKLSAMTDLQDIQNKPTGGDTKSLQVNFRAESASLRVNFKDLSDGEKCFFLFAMVLAASKTYGPIFCFWDEPDNYISLSEVNQFVGSLRSMSKSEGGSSQILMTSHNPEAIRGFSKENTFVLGRKSHLEPTRIKLLDDIELDGDLVNSIILDDLEL